MPLRGYQSEAIKALRGHVAAGRRRLLLAAPTGSGKGVILAEIAKLAVQMGGHALVVVHLRELIDQTYRHLFAMGIDRIGVMRGDDGRRDPWARIQLASIQTLARRDRPTASVVLVDEAHRSSAETYGLNVFDAYPEAIVIGLTATPCRGDGRPLSDRYEVLIEAARYSELIASGHVAEPLVYRATQDPNLSGVRKIAGDWDEGEIEQRMNRVVCNVVDEWRAHAQDRKTIAFASSVAHSKEIVERFIAAGIRAAHLDGTTSSGEREQILSDLGSGALTLVSNCGVLTEGFDMPSIRCAIIARPTLSLVLHMQTAGRCLRPGNERPIILDHANNVDRHGMPHEDRVWSLEGPAKRATDANPYRTCPTCFVYVPRAARECPYCGASKPASEPRPAPVEEPGRMTIATPVNLERAFFDAQVEKARATGFKPGFAGAKFKDKFGRWPPWSWSEETKKAFACDEDWRERQQRRERERQFWNERQSPPEPAQAAPGPSEPEEEDFAGWLARQ